jgi:plastocyanin
MSTTLKIWRGCTTIAVALAVVCGIVLPGFASEAGGTIAGVVRIAGEVPKLPPLAIVRDKDVCGNVPNESLVVGADRGVEYGVLTLEGSDGKAPSPLQDQRTAEAVYRLDNSGCRFVPHVLAMQVDHYVEFTNSDPLLHAVHALFAQGQPQFNLGLYPGRIVRKPIVTPGVVKVICEVHPWMSAYIVATKQPYYAVTDIHGRYEIRDVPPGAYRLKLWHERLGSQERDVRVASGKTEEADFTFPSAGESAR